MSPPCLSMLYLGRNSLEPYDALSPLMYVLFSVPYLGFFAYFLSSISWVRSVVVKPLQIEETEATLCGVLSTAPLSLSSNVAAGLPTCCT